MVNVCHAGQNAVIFLSGGGVDVQPLLTPCEVSLLDALSREPDPVTVHALADKVAISYKYAFATLRRLECRGLVALEASTFRGRPLLARGLGRVMA